MTLNRIAKSSPRSVSVWYLHQTLCKTFSKSIPRQKHYVHIIHACKTDKKLDAGNKTLIFVHTGCVRKLDNVLVSSNIRKHERFPNSSQTIFYVLPWRRKAKPTSPKKTTSAVWTRLNKTTENRQPWRVLKSCRITMLTNTPAVSQSPF